MKELKSALIKVIQAAGAALSKIEETEKAASPAEHKCACAAHKKSFKDIAALAINGGTPAAVKEAVTATVSKPKPKSAKIARILAVQDFQKIGKICGLKKSSAIDTDTAKLRSCVLATVNRLGSPTIADIASVAESTFSWFKENPKRGSNMLSNLISTMSSRGFLLKNGHGKSAHVMISKKKAVK